MTGIRHQPCATKSCAARSDVALGAGCFRASPGRRGQRVSHRLSAPDFRTRSRSGDGRSRSLGRPVGQPCDLGLAGCVSDGHGNGRNAGVDGRAASRNRDRNCGVGDPLGRGGPVRDSSSAPLGGLAGGVLRHLPRPCSRYRVAARTERPALQHGLRHRHGLPACSWNRNRRRPSLALGPTILALRWGGCRDGRFLLSVESFRMNSGTKSRLPIYAAVLFCLALCPMPAEAHLNSTGMGPIYDGLMHFLMSPEDFVPVLALALLAGLRGAAYGRRALFTLPAAWLLGGLIGISAAATNGNAIVSAVWFLLLGGLLALDTKLSLRLVTALAALLGLVQRLPQRDRYGRVRHLVGCSVGIGVRGVRARGLRNRICCPVARAMGPRLGARGRQLDLRQRAADAGMGGSKALSPHQISSKASDTLCSEYSASESDDLCTGRSA